MAKKKERSWLRTPDAARYYYKITGDKIPNDQTVRNWMTKGKVGYGGNRVKLKYVTRERRMRVTCVEWMQNFVEDISNGRAERTIRGKESRDRVARRRTPPPPPPV